MRAYYKHGCIKWYIFGDAVCFKLVFEVPHNICLRNEENNVMDIRRTLQVSRLFFQSNKQRISLLQSCE